MPRVELPWPKPKRNAQVWLRDNLRFLREAFHYMVLHPLQTLFVILLVSVSLALPAGLWVVRDYLNYEEWVWPSAQGFNAFFASDVSESSINATAQTIKGHEYVTDVYQIPKDVALQEFLAAADLPDIAEELDENPLPDTLTVYVRDSITQAEFDRLVTFIRDLKSIETVSYDPEIVLRFSAIRGVIDRMMWALGLTFAGFALFVTVSAIRIAIEERIHEIRVMYVLGSPMRFIRGSFLWCGVVYGAVGGYAAAVLLSLVLIYLETPLHTLSESYGITRDLRSLDWLFVLALGGVGVLLGLCSALYSTWRHISSITKDWVL